MQSPGSTLQHSCTATSKESPAWIQFNLPFTIPEKYYHYQILKAPWTQFSPSAFFWQLKCKLKITPWAFFFKIKILLCKGRWIYHYASKKKVIINVLLSCQTIVLLLFLFLVGLVIRSKLFNNLINHQSFFYIIFRSWRQTCVQSWDLETVWASPLRGAWVLLLPITMTQRSVQFSFQITGVRVVLYKSITHIAVYVLLSSNDDTHIFSMCYNEKHAIVLLVFIPSQPVKVNNFTAFYWLKDMVTIITEIKVSS